MCVGAFEGVERREKKRGRPKKNKGDLEDGDEDGDNEEDGGGECEDSQPSSGNSSSGTEKPAKKRRMKSVKKKEAGPAQDDRQGSIESTYSTATATSVYTESNLDDENSGDDTEDAPTPRDFHDLDLDITSPPLASASATSLIPDLNLALDLDVDIDTPAPSSHSSSSSSSTTSLSTKEDSLAAITTAAVADTPPTSPPDHDNDYYDFDDLIDKDTNVTTSFADESLDYADLGIGEIMAGKPVEGNAAEFVFDEGEDIFRGLVGEGLPMGKGHDILDVGVDLGVGVDVDVVGLDMGAGLFIKPEMLSSS